MLLCRNEKEKNIGKMIRKCIKTQKIIEFLTNCFCDNHHGDAEIFIPKKIALFNARFNRRTAFLFRSYFDDSLTYGFFSNKYMVRAVIFVILEIFVYFENTTQDGIILIIPSK